MNVTFCVCLCVCVCVEKDFGLFKRCEISCPNLVLMRDSPIPIPYLILNPTNDPKQCIRFAVTCLGIKYV